MNKISFKWLFLLLALQACTTQVGQYSSLTAKDKEKLMTSIEKNGNMVCIRSREIGSHMVKRRCIPKEQQENERFDSQEKARELARNPNINF